jgi:hypothetical protein
MPGLAGIECATVWPTSLTDPIWLSGGAMLQKKKFHIEMKIAVTKSKWISHNIKTNSHDQQNKVSTVTFHQCYTPKIGPLQARVKNGSFSKLKGLVILKATAGHVCLVFLFIFKYQIPQRSSRQTEVINLGCRISSRDLYYFECL